MRNGWSDGTRYAALDHGHFGVKLHRSPAGGAWEEIAAPVYPPKPADAVDTDPWGKDIPWSTVRIWALEPGEPDEAWLLWCGTIPGDLFRVDLAPLGIVEPALQPSRHGVSPVICCWRAFPRGNSQINWTGEGACR